MKEFERKLSQFYGIELTLVTLIMDVWICPNEREIDNVVLMLEPTQNDDSE